MEAILDKFEQTNVFNRDNLPSELYFVRQTANNKTIAVDIFLIIDKFPPLHGLILTESIQGHIFSFQN
jgi:hypothetical protein